MYFFQKNTVNISHYVIQGIENPDEEAECIICLEHDGYEDDAIVFCDLCNSSFHQSCFGSELLNLSEDDESIFLEKKIFLISHN